MKPPIILIISLFLTIAGNAIAGEKEYLLKICKSLGDAQDCEQCEVQGKISFKVSKSLSSVMATVKDKDESASFVINNCKIFDDETFECETKNEGAVHSEVGASEGLDILDRLSNGKYIRIYHLNSTIFFYPQYLDKGEDSISPGGGFYKCATEIKGLLNWFK
ncbi:MAG: hypothetical protein ACXW1W_11160 [Methylococcaceae bacterium]